MKVQILLVSKDALSLGNELFSRQNSLLPLLRVHLSACLCEEFLNSDECCLDLDGRSSNFLLQGVPTRSREPRMVELVVILSKTMISIFLWATFCSFIVLLNINRNLTLGNRNGSSLEIFSVNIFCVKGILNIFYIFTYF
jgi:hypothetical protein